MEMKIVFQGGRKQVVWNLLMIDAKEEKSIMDWVENQKNSVEKVVNGVQVGRFIVNGISKLLSR
jgi:hypothetical protein